ncbi:TPA: ABC transporter ATP-binding protein [Pseudomonas aeruginosa]|nr:ABC transporter ATP-binding protein [Pseudomonas aeruginosa]
MSLVEIDGATLRYGALTALSGLDLRLEPGEVLGLLGHNGAGKTTTIKLVLGLLAPSEGRVRVLGHDARSLEARRQLGYLPENVTFYPQLSGAETLRHFARLKGVAPAEAARLLEQVGLGHAARRRLKTYSKGMRQRLGLAQALLGEPRLLLLDEPTVGLDPLATIELYQLLDRLRGQGTGIVLCSHVLPGVETHIDRAAILAGGCLQVAGSLAELRRKAALPTRVRLASPHNPQWLERWHRAGLAARRLDDLRIEVLLDDAERDGVLEALLAAREFDLEILPPSLEDLYRHHMSPAPAGATPCP